MKFLSASSQRLNRLLEGRWCLPYALLDELELNAEFAAALRTNVGVRDAFTLRRHTLWVMDCYEVHFAERPEVDRRSRALFRLFLALHDIGKPRAIAAGDKRLQHRFTVDLMTKHRAAFPVTDREFGDWIALVDGDPVGGFLKGEMTAEPARSEIQRMTRRSSLDKRAFLKQLMIYYQCDVSAYTSRTGFAGTLDSLFEWQVPPTEIRFDPNAGLLRFSERVRARLDGLADGIVRVES